MIGGDDMLTIFDTTPLDDTSVIRDVEEAFSSFELKGDTCTRNLMKYIDKADYVDSIRFSDRFGDLLYLDNLSSGCKAALCVHYLQDSIVDLAEGGLNVRDAVIAYCTEGNVLIHDWDVSLAEIPDLGTAASIQYNSVTYTPEDFDKEVLC